MRAGKEGRGRVYCLDNRKMASRGSHDILFGEGRETGSEAPLNLPDNQVCINISKQFFTIGTKILPRRHLITSRDRC